MDGLLIFLISVSLTGIAVFVWRYRHYNKEKALVLPKEAPHYIDDSIKSAKAIGAFLKERADVAGITFDSPKNHYTTMHENAMEVFAGRSAGIVALNRIAHSLGCEVIVRERTDHGLDDMKSEEELQVEKKKCLKEKEINEKLKELGF